MREIKSLLREAIHRLKTSTPTPQLDAELLFAHVLKKSRAFLYAHSDEPLESAVVAHIESLISERLLGVPIAYLLEEREFWSLLLHVTPSTLIPRPETELLVQLALDLFKTRKTCSVLELGTGTGAISVALATEKPDWHFLASDQSADALLVAEKNIKRHHIKNMTLIHSNWFEKLSQLQFDLIISNPPYLSSDDPHQYQGDLRFEPREALVSGIDGLNDLTIIVKESMKHLTPGGLLLLEHGYNQGKVVIQKLVLAGYKPVQSWRDDNNHERVSAGWKEV